MIKIILLIGISLVGVSALEVVRSNVLVRGTVEITNIKTYDKSWNESGHAYDIYLKVDGAKIMLQKECKDSYRCENIVFISDKKTFSIEVYAKNLTNEGLIAKGECLLGSSCVLGNVMIRLSCIDINELVLADARSETKILKAETRKSLVYIATLLHMQNAVNDSTLKTLIRKIQHLRAYADDISEKEILLLQNIVQLLQKYKNNNTLLIDTLELLSHTSKTRIS